MSSKKTEAPVTLESHPGYAAAAEVHRQALDSLQNLQREREELTRHLRHLAEDPDAAALALLGRGGEGHFAPESARARLAAIGDRIPTLERAVVIAWKDVERERLAASATIVARVSAEHRAIALRLCRALCDMEEALEAANGLRAELEGAGVEARTLPPSLSVGFRTGHEGVVDRWVKRIIEADVLAITDLPGRAIDYAPPLRRAS